MGVIECKESPGLGAERARRKEGQADVRRCRIYGAGREPWDWG